MKFKLLLLALIASTANAQTVSQDSESAAEIKVAQTLIDLHFKVFNETDSSKRLRQFPAAYTPAVFMGDAGGSSKGYKELETMIVKVQKAHPGFEFHPEQVTMNHGLGRVAWWYGPKENSHAVRGEDIFTVEKEKLSSFRVYITTSESVTESKP